MQDQWLVEAWAQELVSVLQMMAVQEFEYEIAPGRVPPLSNHVVWRQAFNVAAKAPVWIAATEQAWMELGRRSLEAAGIDVVEPDTASSTYLEIIQQSLSATAGALGRKFGRTVECMREEPKGDDPAEAFCVMLRTGGINIDSLYFYAPPELHQLGSPPASSPAPAPPAKTEALVAAPPPSPPSHTSADMLLDVEMPVSISFGRTHLPLKDVMKFTAGSVVELNRHPEEAVEVLINNCVIARGEVVVIDGNYGVRIQEIISRQQRLAIRNFDRSAVAGR